MYVKKIVLKDRTGHSEIVFSNGLRVSSSLITSILYILLTKFDWGSWTYVELWPQLTEAKDLTYWID